MLTLLCEPQGTFTWWPSALRQRLRVAVTQRRAKECVQIYSFPLCFAFVFTWGFDVHLRNACASLEACTFFECSAEALLTQNSSSIIHLPFVPLLSSHSEARYEYIMSHHHMKNYYHYEKHYYALQYPHTNSHGIKTVNVFYHNCSWVWGLNLM